MLAVTLPDTADLGEKLGHGARIGGRSPATVDKDGNLLVALKKIDGKWYWNPFGW